MKRAIYPGSFDPVTYGHLDIISRASTVFDEVVIAVIQNPNKNALFSVDERIELIRSQVGHVCGVRVEGFEGLLVDFAASLDVYTIIRGLRAVSDFEFEFQMALTNRQLSSKIDTVFLMTDHRYAFLSSSIVRQIAKLNGDVSAFVPDCVGVALKEKFIHE
jgi:pantetheine-phosphate adenylyltransferase